LKSSAQQPYSKTGAFQRREVVKDPNLNLKHIPDNWYDFSNKPALNKIA
jgi:hypothetical protein